MLEDLAQMGKLVVDSSLNLLSFDTNFKAQRSKTKVSFGLEPIINVKYGTNICWFQIFSSLSANSRLSAYIGEVQPAEIGSLSGSRRTVL